MVPGWHYKNAVVFTCKFVSWKAFISGVNRVLLCMWLQYNSLCEFISTNQLIVRSLWVTITIDTPNWSPTYDNTSVPTSVCQSKRGGSSLKAWGPLYFRGHTPNLTDWGRHRLFSCIVEKFGKVIYLAIGDCRQRHDCNGLRQYHTVA